MEVLNIEYVQFNIIQGLVVFELEYFHKEFDKLDNLNRGYVQLEFIDL